MKLIGVQKIVSKKTGTVYAKCSFIDESSKPGLVGCEACIEWLPFDSSYADHIGDDCNIIYTKGSNGRAYAQGLSLV